MLFSVPSKAPNGVRVTSFEFTSDLLVEWNPLPQQYANGKLLGYIIYYWENQDDSSYKWVFAPGQSSSYFTLKDLKPALQYQVTVTAFTSKGVGPLSDFNYITTGMFFAIDFVYIMSGTAFQLWKKCCHIIVNSGKKLRSPVNIHQRI